MVETTITDADVSPNGVWFEVNGDERTFITRTELVRGFDGLDGIEGL
jgi:hypothetical protein